MIDFSTATPLPDAVASLGNRTPLGSLLSSAEWEREPEEIRRVSFWSARVIDEVILGEMQRRILQAVRQERDAVAAGGRVMERGRFVLEMQEILRRAGYQPDPEKRGGLQDLSSSRRLSLIWEMQLAIARGHAADKVRKSDVGLRRAPAQELIRGMQRMHERDWPRIWQEHGGKFYGGPGSNLDYPRSPGRMIALVTDPIWRAISQFKLPYPPFAYGSGMVLQSIRRRDALELGVIKEGDAAPTAPASPSAPTSPRRPPTSPSAPGAPASPASPSPALGTGLRVSMGLSEPDAYERLRSELGDSIRFDGNQAVYHTATNSSASDVHWQETDASLREALRARARSAFDSGEGVLGRLRRESDAAEALFAGDQAAAVRYSYLAQLAAVSNGRKRLFHENITEADAQPLIAAARSMPGVRAEWKDGHVLVWREDLVSQSLDELVQLSGENPVARNGELLGYGMPSMGGPDDDYAVVLIRDPDGDVVSGFHSPLRTARTYAEARTRDFADATGEPFTYDIIPRPKGGGR
ncbi:hypothetical protein OKA04_04690 [Luteolibacter flavescens]|uniref:Uncharacterized protein n=1 Tax=Luteolibacter flavescens TaxID=1859460 RepID=A0ABT3FLF4_9BACT|nr:hypothetical protein [Luteolibacter flavescens]MCW1884014.1 hypothetical protein [Luteolibacter flavescens]